MAGNGTNDVKPRRAVRPLGIFFVGWLTFAIAALAVQQPLVPPAMDQYTGVAKFTRRLDPAAEGLEAVRSESFASRKLTLRHDLAGRKAVERAARDLPLLQGPQFPRTEDGELTDKGMQAKQALLQQLQDQVEVVWEVSSDEVDLIAVRFTHSDPKLAGDLPNTLVRKYIRWVSAESVRNLKRSKDWLADQVRECRREYEQVNKALFEFERKYAGMMPDRPGALEERIRQIRSDIRELNQQREVARIKLSRLEAMQKQPDAEGPPAPASEGQPTNRRGMHADLATVTARNEYDTAERELERLEARLQKYEELSGNFATVRQEYEQKVRRVEECRQELLSWQKPLENVETALQAQVAQRRIHLDAVLAAQPSWEPDAVPLLNLLVIPVVGGLLCSAVVTLVILGLSRSVGMTLIYLTLVATFVGLVIAITILHNVELPSPNLFWLPSL